MGGYRHHHHYGNEGEDNEVDLTGNKLSLFISPVVPDEKRFAEPAISRASTLVVSDTARGSDMEGLTLRYTARDIPEFEKVYNEKSTSLEIFYDLWFVANLSVFTQVHQVSDASKLWSLVGYISILWFNWFLVGCFDVRFVTDSIFERAARTIHLGVMVGFAIVATYFDPEEQTKGTFQALSLILMVSRLVLVVEYSVVIWHIRRFTMGQRALAVATAFHLAAALVYLGISFRFEDGRNSHVYVAWYAVGIAEVAIQLGVSFCARVLSFDGTHLTERLTLLTVIILGEGVMAIIENVITIVKNNAWTAPTVGVLIAAISIIYIIFMCYFDFMAKHFRLAGWRQLVWSILHFPFHIFLMLFTEGISQFVSWWKVIELQNFLTDQFLGVADRLVEEGSSGEVTHFTARMLVDRLNATVNHVWAVYEPKYATTVVEVERVLADVLALPDSFLNSEDPDPALLARLTNDSASLQITVMNSVLVNFKVDQFEDMVETNLTKAQYDAIDQTAGQFFLVFQYVYATAGLTLIAMTILAILAKQRGWTVFNAARMLLFLLLGAMLSLLTLLSLDSARRVAFVSSPWVLPALTLVFFLVLALTHLPHPRRALCLGRLRRGARGRGKSDVSPGAYASVDSGGGGGFGVGFGFGFAGSSPPLGGFAPPAGVYPLDGTPAMYPGLYDAHGNNNNNNNAQTSLYAMGGVGGGGDLPPAQMVPPPAPYYDASAAAAYQYNVPPASVPYSHDMGVGGAYQPEGLGYGVGGGETEGAAEGQRRWRG